MSNQLPLVPVPAAALPHLPVELWTAIYGFMAVAEPGTVTLRTLTSRAPPAYIHREIAIHRDPPGVPTTLHINHDVRAAVLPHYHIVFTALHAPGLYFNYELDTLDTSDVRADWWVSYPLARELHLVCNLIAPALTRPAQSRRLLHQTFDFSDLHVYTHLRTLRMPRDNAILDAAGMSNFEYDGIGRREFDVWGMANLPFAMPIPRLTFFSVPRLLSRYATGLRDREGDEESIGRNVRMDEVMSMGGGGF